MIMYVMNFTKNKNEKEYCTNNCNNLTENCIRRLMRCRMSDK